MASLTSFANFPETGHPPASVAAAILDAVAADAEELIVDERTRQMKDALPRELELICPAIGRQFTGR